MPNYGRSFWLKSGPQLKKHSTLMCGFGAIWLNFPKKFASQDFYKSFDHVELLPNSFKSYYLLPQSGMGIQSFFSHKAIVTPSRDDPLSLWLSGLKSALNCTIIQQGVCWGFERRESSSPKGTGWPSQGLGGRVGSICETGFWMCSEGPEHKIGQGIQNSISWKEFTDWYKLSVKVILRSLEKAMAHFEWWWDA